MSGGAFSRFRAGESGAARVAVAEYGAVAYAAAFGVLRAAAAAEVVAAEVLTEGLAGGDIPSGDPFAERLWVVATARSQALAVARAHRRHRIGRRGRASVAPEPAREGWMGDVIDAEVAHSGFEALPLAARDALSLAYGSGLQPSAVGKRIGFTADEVRDVLREGLIEIEHRLAEGVT